MKRTKKYLEAENKWLWYNHLDADEDAEFVEIKQYNKKDEVIRCATMLFPPKEYRVKHPNEETKGQ